MKVFQDKYKLELTQEELNTIILSIGEIGGKEMEQLATDFNVKIDNIREMYIELENYLL